MTTVLPQVFKGIALFTPGGDLIYGVAPHKQTQWHIDLCQRLQQTMGLADAPHFLVPGYTATIERSLEPQSNRLKTIAEVYPAVQHYIPLLQAIFELESKTQWHIAPWQEELCNRAVIETYRAHYPQLWQRQNLILRHDPGYSLQYPSQQNPNVYGQQTNAIKSTDSPEGYVLRLFISSEDPDTEQTLSQIHQLLEDGLLTPYTLKVIDLAKNPEQALSHRVATTPTLVRVSPKPELRITGQFDDTSRVLNIISSF
ncbi:MAG: circadian clock KaiB family protein [Cyanobacteria bacterium J06621_8]